MKKSQLEYKIKELKADYIRVQGDIEKLEATGHGMEKAEQLLVSIEKELSELNNQLLLCTAEQNPLKKRFAL